MSGKMQAIKKELEALGYIGVFWHIDDVKEVRPDLTAAQCWRVLHQHQRQHDCDVGINWETISHWADLLFPEPEEAA